MHTFLPDLQNSLPVGTSVRRTYREALLPSSRACRLYSALHLRPLSAAGTVRHTKIPKQRSALKRRCGRIQILKPLRFHISHRIRYRLSAAKASAVGAPLLLLPAGAPCSSHSRSFLHGRRVPARPALTRTVMAAGISVISVHLSDLDFRLHESFLSYRIRGGIADVSASADKSCKTPKPIFRAPFPLPQPSLSGRQHMPPVRRCQSLRHGIRCKTDCTPQVPSFRSFAVPQYFAAAPLLPFYALPNSVCLFPVFPRGRAPPLNRSH